MAPTIGVNIRVTGHCNQGSRRHMEDMFSVAYQQTEDELDLEYAYFGIFDGHGGHEAATFAKEHLMKAIISEPGFWSDDDKDVLRAIKDGFIATHYAMWRNLEKWPKTQSGWPSTSGTTASIAFIRRSNVYIGHVGDSCIVLGYKDPCSSQWRGAPLTRDHKPENPTELERISEAGGTVVTKSGVPRVVWQRPRIPNKGPLTRSTHIDQIPFLAVARSLGDLWSYNADSDRFVVSPEPDVSVYHLDVSRDRCLIFGTDGLWNMLTPDEAVSIVEKAEGFNKEGGVDSQDNTWLNPSKCLVDHALKKWIKFKLRADNTSAVTLILGASGRPHSEILSHQRAASRPQEFVPYYIESYNVTEEKLPTKVHSQSSGLAICTWYPHKNLSDHLNGMTTLSTMEELFGKKVEACDGSKEENDANDDAEKEEESNMKPTFPLFLKCASSKTISQKALENKKYPSAVKFPNQNINNNNNSNNNKELESKKYPSAVKFPNRNSGTSNSEGDEKTVQKVMKEISTKVEETSEGKKEKLVNLISGDENDNHEVDENVNKMKLRDSSVTNKIPPEPKIENDLSVTKNCQKTSLRSKSLRRTCKRGKKRKNYEMIKSQLNLLDDTIMLRTRSKRRHSSLLETVSLIYEPRPKRRTRSEDQKKLSDCEEYKSDTENTLSEDSNKSRKMTKLQSKTSEVDMRPETPEENSRQNHLQERLQHSNNSNSNQLNNSTINSNNNNSNNSNSNNSSSVQDFTPMRLRSNMPVKTLRSRNINLEISDWFLLGLPKINVNANKKSLSKQSYKPEESHSDHHKSLSKLSVLTRGSMNAAKIQMNDSPHRSAVHTRSQNKRLKK